MARAKKGTTKPKRTAKPAKPSPAQQAESARRTRDDHFGAIVKGLRESVMNMQLRPEDAAGYGSSLDELLVLYSAK